MRTTLEVEQWSKDRTSEYRRKAEQYQVWKSLRSGTREKRSVWQMLVRLVYQAKENRSLLRDLATAEAENRS